MSGEYPPDWSTPELGDFAKATGGSRFPPSAQGSKEGDYPFYKVSDMNLAGNERFMGVANHWITEATRKQITARTFPAGSVIFPKIGAAVATNKKRLLTQESIIDNNVMAVVVDDPKRCEFSYLRFWFETIDLRDLSNSGALPSIPGHRVHTIRVPLPPLPEQKKIAHILSTVQRAIEAQERIILTTTELKKALMHKLFTEGLCGEPRKQTEIGPIPKSWELLPIGELFETQLGKMLSQKAKVGDSPKAYLRNKNVQWGRIDTDDLLTMDFNNREAEKFVLQDGDLLVCEGGEVGRAAIWRGQITHCYYQKALHRLRPRSGMITNEFMAHWLMYAFLLTNTYGVTGTRTTIAHLPEIKLKPLLVPIPSPEERDEIVRTLDTSDQNIENHRGKHSQLQVLFRTLLHELMSAKTRVNYLILNTEVNT